MYYKEPSFIIIKLRRTKDKLVGTEAVRQMTMETQTGVYQRAFAREKGTMTEVLKDENMMEKAVYEEVMARALVAEVGTCLVIG